MDEIRARYNVTVEHVFSKNDSTYRKRFITNVGLFEVTEDDRTEFVGTNKKYSIKVLSRARSLPSIRMYRLIRTKMTYYKRSKDIDSTMLEFIEAYANSK